MVSAQYNLDIAIKLFNEGGDTSGSVELEAHRADTDKFRFVGKEGVFDSGGKFLSHEDQVCQVNIVVPEIPGNGRYG
ncbi:MAG: hypothetical protein SCALA701_23720 [Candidatus Scalindua sp.]|nr:MAG: hypothetical protein SCALA701_23720 [Candidatus Scalindua sp.]